MVKEHPILIPTSVGTMAGMVAEPGGDPRAATILLPGAGGPGRAGVNAFWTRVSRSLGERGFLTLRFDYPNRGNGSSAPAPGVDLEALAEAGEDADLLAMVDVATWFRERTDRLDVYVAGECHGARMALELLPHDSDVAGVFVVAPYLRDRFVPLGVRETPGFCEDDGVRILDEKLLVSLRELLERGRPAWILIGGQEGDDPLRLQQRLGDAGRLLEIEVVPDRKLHPVASPAVQAEVGSRLMRRIALALDLGLSDVSGPSPPCLPPGPDMTPARQAARMAMRQLAFLQEARDRYGDVFTLRLPDEDPLILVGDPELARQVFSAPEDVLSASEGNRPVLAPLLGECSLFLLAGERHLSHRRILLPPFHGARLERQGEAMRSLAEAQLNSWPVGQELPALPRMRELALDVVVGTVFGVEGEGWSRPLRDALLALRLPMNARDGASPKYRRMVQRAEMLIGEVVARRRTDSSPEECDDVLSLLLGSRLEDGSLLSNVEIRDELLTLVMAGMETTATSLAWALERLARSPEALARATREAARGGGPYLEATIYETLRMRPAVPMSTRLVQRPFALGEYLIPPGARVSPSAFLIHHHAHVYPEPMSFRPERFLDDPPGTYTWIPFGGGVRRCIGGSFALMEMRIVLSTLLSRMTLQSVGSKPEGVRNRAIISVPARQAEIVLESRESRDAVDRSPDIEVSG
jgi:cytochrome P450/alpha/beta superfamily hydrolase